MAQRIHFDAWYSVVRLSRAPKYSAESVFWAAWWPDEPQPKPWRTPKLFGYCGTVDSAHIEADLAIRRAIGRTVAVRSMHQSFAAAARRESQGRPPAYVTPAPRRRKEKRSPEDERRWQDWQAGEGAYWREHVRREREEFLRSVGAGGTDEALAHFGLKVGATVADVKHAFKRRVLVEHPDRGGDAAAFRKTRALYDVALRHAEGAGR